MNKEEAKKQIDEVINQLEWRRGGWTDYVKNYRTTVHAIIDKIEPDHSKVELTESPAKVMVSEEEAKVLKKAKDTTAWRPAAVISEYAYYAEKDSGQEALLEDRLMRAYVNGYTVAKEKKYLLPMDGTLEENDGYNNYQLYAYCYKGRWLIDECETDPSYLHFTVTQKELETAPAWVKAIKPFEVTEDDE